MVKKCLSRQTLTDFEWLVCSPFEYKDADKWVPEPAKNPGDYYGLCKAMNALFKQSQGDLVVQITDWIYFAPDTLQKLWDHYTQDPMSCVTAVGDQYSEVENGKPEFKVWGDPRKTTDMGTYYEVYPIDMELCIGSLPKAGLVAAGGVDEAYDQGAAIGEKELCLRLDKLGYKFYIDQTIDYRALKHPRISEDWDDKYKIASELFQRHVQQINSGERLKVDYL